MCWPPWTNTGPSNIVVGRRRVVLGQARPIFRGATLALKERYLIIMDSPGRQMADVRHSIQDVFSLLWDPNLNLHLPQLHPGWGVFFWIQTKPGWWVGLKNPQRSENPGWKWVKSQKFHNHHVFQPPLVSMTQLDLQNVGKKRILNPFSTGNKKIQL